MSFSFKLKRVVIVATSLFVGLLLGEALLAILGFHADYTGDPTHDELVLAQFWTCDQDGCRYNRQGFEAQRAVLPPRVLSNPRLQILNSQGYADLEEFSASPQLDSTYRILVLGDSFTFGSSSTYGHSYVELLESSLRARAHITMWNTGIGGTGTNNALAVCKRFLPILRPHLVVLGFYCGNDFIDNLYPIDQQIVTISGETLRCYRLDESITPVRLSPEESFLRAHKAFPANSIGLWRYVFGRTRFGSLALHVFLPRVLFESTSQRFRRRAIVQTERIVLELRDTIQASGAHMLVLLIPTRENLQCPGPWYKSAYSIFDKAAIDWIDVRPFLASDDYASPPDGHWGDSGHRKASKVLQTRIAPLIPLEFCKF